MCFYYRRLTFITVISGLWSCRSNWTWNKYWHWSSLRSCCAPRYAVPGSEILQIKPQVEIEKKKKEKGEKIFWELLFRKVWKERNTKCLEKNGNRRVHIPNWKPTHTNTGWFLDELYNQPIRPHTQNPAVIGWLSVMLECLLGGMGQTEEQGDVPRSFHLVNTSHSRSRCISFPLTYFSLFF